MPPPHTSIEGFSGNDFGDAEVVIAPVTGGLWALSGDRLDCIDALAAGPPVVLVPSEAVLTLAVPLPPLGNAMRRREALPFAIEDAIAEPLDQVHVALGTEQAPGVWLAGIVSHVVMRDWTARLHEAGLARAVMLPDALRLPVPAEASWAVDMTADRALVRVSDGSGFALPAAQFEFAWHAAGKPACIAYGMPLPQFGATQADPVAVAPALDLRQGVYAAPRRPFNPLWRRIAMVAGIGALAHGVIAIADTAALTHLAHAREAQVRTLAAGLQPPVTIGSDLGDTLNALSPDDAAVAPSRFMALLTRSAAAIGAGQNPGQNPALWRSVAFDRAAGTLTIEVEANDIADLQRIAQSLTKAGLSAQPGSASSESGHAVGSFVIRAP
ncbi:type II secretion system protein GspL [Novosphingobium sp.]|uniref:type II secretion system protein GspL n=1 Tax=Novosphingobium sp. TaxID=1874826 RepID=UPI003D117E98